MANEKKHRRKRYVRQSHPKRINLTERDQAVIDAVYRYRVLNTEQIRRLFFTDVTRRVAERRLIALWDNGYLDRRPPPPNANILNPMASPILYLLDKKGNQFLLAQGYDEVRWNPRHNSVGYEHLEHLLAINNVRIALELACRKSENISLDEWLDDTTLKQDHDRVSIVGSNRPVVVIPDGYFRLHLADGIVHFFLEVDRANMESKRIKRKVRAYLAYRREAQVRFGSSKFRVLFVTTSDQRLFNLKQATEQVNGKTRFWFTVLDAIDEETILSQPIWHIAGRENTFTLL